MNETIKDQVLNVYGYREEYVPRRAPQGKLFYIVHPNPEVANRKYLYCLKRNIEARTSVPVLFHDRERSMAFDDIDLASSFCRFLRQICHHDGQFYVVLEAGSRRLTEKPRRRRKWQE